MAWRKPGFLPANGCRRATPARNLLRRASRQSVSCAASGSPLCIRSHVAVSRRCTLKRLARCC
ncbi:hypothetical protein SAMCCGM7_Ch2274 [Sinorhizobium americanum CCGM7]|nr:hypothetical protein SAMCCGM7_Ch2274 [Sinorhizobium americanum CCGM7]